jgi:hypothetical protein
MIKAVQQSYQCLAQGKVDPFMGKGGVGAFMKVAQTITGLDQLVEIERRTMKD